MQNGRLGPRIGEAVRLLARLLPLFGGAPLRILGLLHLGSLHLTEIVSV